MSDLYLLINQYGIEAGNRIFKAEREVEYLKKNKNSNGAARSEIAKAQAEAVVPAIMITGREFGRGDLVYSSLRLFAEDYADRFLQQADELDQ